MFTPRFVAVLAIGIAVAAALPADPENKPKLPRPVTTISETDFEDGGFFAFPMFSNFFAPIWRLFPSFSDFGPKIIADDKDFKVVINVKDYNKDDLKVKLKGDFIFVEGSHQAKHEDHDLFASQFFHTYSLPANASSADVTAELTKDGYLIVDAPCNGESKAEKVDREVPIKETGAAYKNDNDDKAESKPELDDDDRKEPTTPPTDRDVTNISVKDNDIPHGTDVPL